MTTTTTSNTSGRTPAPGRSPSQRAIAGTIAARALADRVTIVGALAFYSLAGRRGRSTVAPPEEDFRLPVGQSARRVRPNPGERVHGHPRRVDERGDDVAG